MSIEKGIGIYLVFLAAIDTSMAWSLSCFLTLEYVDTSIEEIGYYSGFIILIYSIGKIAGYKAVSNSIYTVNVKWVLAILFLGSGVSIITIGALSSFTGILCCRFFSGIFSNSQQVLRKLLLDIETKRKGDWNSLSNSILWGNRLGMLVGILIGTFLSQPSDFLPESSNLVQKKFLLSCLTVLIIDLSGLILIFSMDSKKITINEPKKYIELPEVKERKDSEPSDIQKEKFDIQNFLHSSSIIPNENLVSEESVGPEEIKFYSPRSIANRDVNSRRLNSTRPKPDSSFNFNHPQPDVKEPEKHEGDGKKTHISFIEEEFENMPEIQEERQDEKVEISPVEPVTHLKFAVIYRSILTFWISMLFESIPYYLILHVSGRNVYILGLILLITTSTGILFSLYTSKILLERLSYNTLLSYFLLFQGAILFFVPFLVYLPSGVFIIVALMASIYCIEFLMPAGCIMVSDASSLLDRESTIENSDMICIAIKGFGAYLGPSGLSALRIFSFSLWINGIGFCLLLLCSKRIKLYFPCMGISPYKL